MSWCILLLLVATCVSCKNPYVIDAKGIEVEDRDTTDSTYHISYDDSDTDEYLEKPMVTEVDADGIDTTDPANNYKPWLDWPDSTDRALFISPAQSTTDEQTVDNETVDEQRDHEAP